MAEYLARLEADVAVQEGGDGRGGSPDGEPTPKPDRKTSKVISPSDPSSAWTAQSQQACTVRIWAQLSYRRRARDHCRCRSGRHSAEGFGDQIPQFYDKAPDSASRTALLGDLADLCLSKPFKDDFHRIAARFGDIAKHLHDLTRSEALQLGDKGPPTYLLRALMVVERAGREGFTKEAKPQLHELVRENQKSIVRSFGPMSLNSALTDDTVRS